MSLTLDNTNLDNTNLQNTTTVPIKSVVKADDTRTINRNDIESEFKNEEKLETETVNLHMS